MNTHHPIAHLTPDKMQGFTLLELLIALTISLLITAAVGYVYIGSLQAYRTQDALSRLQEGARYAFEILSKEVRMAGLSGCGSQTSANVLANPAWYGNLYSAPLWGYEGGVSTFPADVTGALANRDALTVLRADTSRDYVVVSHNPVSAQMNIDINGDGVSDSSDKTDLQAGEVLVVCGQLEVSPGVCDSSNTHSAVFQMTGPSTAAPNNAVHNTGVAGVSPGNCSKKLGNPVPSPCDSSTPASAGTDYTFCPGTRLYRVKGITYFVRNNPAGEPALYQQRLVVSGTSAATIAEELVEGVEDMQITYGVDTDSSDDGTPAVLNTKVYLRADQMTNANVPGWANDSERWGRVVSVRISLLMRTPQNGVVPSPQTYTFNGVTVTPTDRRLRKVFTHVVKVRNR